MIGDPGNVLKRIKALVPPTWFGQQQGDTPVLDALLSGPAWALSYIYGVYAYAKLQTRLASATDGFLDLFAADFFGGELPREGRSDADYRAWIAASLFRPKTTRESVEEILTELTGNVPAIFEPSGLMGVGGYDAGMGYDEAGAYDLLDLHYTAFVTAFRGHGVDDAHIAAAVNLVRPIGTILWVKIEDLGPPGELDFHVPRNSAYLGVI